MAQVNSRVSTCRVFMDMGDDLFTGGNWWRCLGDTSRDDRERDTETGRGRKEIQQNAPVEHMILLSCRWRSSVYVSEEEKERKEEGEDEEAIEMKQGKKRLTQNQLWSTHRSDSSDFSERRQLNAVHTWIRKVCRLLTNEWGSECYSIENDWWWIKYAETTGINE